MTEDDPKRPASGPDTPDGPDASTSSSFWSELKRRKVFRVASVYVVTGWIIIQVASSTFENFGIPVWAFRFVTLMVLMGLPVAVILTWAFELTPEGFKTTKSARSERGGKEPEPEAQKKRNWVAYATGALIPTLIFGALAGFFYFQTRGTDSEPSTVQASPAQIEEAAMSIAMMPLINMSSDEENAYFAGGIHEDVLTNLTRIEDLQVISRTTMLRYASTELTLPEIGEALGVDYIVEGSVRRIGNHVRVTVQLINARNDHHLWASNYERELVDVFATQSELAREISNSIHLELQPESVGTLSGMPTTSVLAYDLYLKAISIEKTEDTTEENVLKSTGLLEQAVEEDPDFVEAWGLLKRRYDLIRNRIRGPGWVIADGENRQAAMRRFKEKSDRALAKAMALDPNNVETLLAQAVNHENQKTPEFANQQKEIYDTIIATHPENADAWYHLGWWYWHLAPMDEENAIRAWEEALKRDPFNARYVRAFLERYRALADQENVNRMAELLTQIVPEVAEDQQLDKIDRLQRMRTIQWAFLATANEKLLAIWARIWNDPKTWDPWTRPVPVSFIRLFTGFELWTAAGEPGRIIETSENLTWPDPLPEQLRTLPLFIHMTAMEAHLALDQRPEAEASARKMLEFYEKTSSPDQPISNPMQMYFLSRAHGVLGQSSEAKAISDQLIARRSDEFDSDGAAGIQSLIPIDLDRAVHLALVEKEADPDWDGMDEIAARNLLYPEFVTHPRAQEYYVNEGKWVAILAKRFPEYAAYVEQNALNE